MKKDIYTTRYEVIYGLVMSVILIVIALGAFSLSQTAFFSRAYIESLIKTPLYRAEFYLEENGLGNLFPPQRTRTPAPDGVATSVPVLMYHGVMKKPDDSTSNLTIEQFKDHMLALKDAGYTTVSLDDFTAFIRGEKTLPKRSVLITFDDGRRDSYYNAGPILSALDFTAVMYMIGMFTEETIGPVGNYYLSGRETAHLAKSATWEIGSHSYNGHREINQDRDGIKKTYFLGGRMWLPEKNALESLSEFTTRVRDDLQQSQKLFQNLTGEEIKTLAFPFGNYGEDTNVTEGDLEIRDTVLAEASQLYDLLFYQSSPQQYFTQAYISPDENSRDQTLVRRITITNDMTGSDLVRFLISGTAKTLPFAAVFNENEGWVEAWGATVIEDGNLTLDAEGSGAGAATVLDGTRHWTDYRVDVDVTSENGSSVVLMVRHDSQGNNAACNYGRTFVHINQTIDGTERVIRGSDNLALLAPQGETQLQIAAEVQGRTMRCYLDDQLMVETEFLDPSLDQGGVGLKTWNAATNAKITTHTFNASYVRQ